MKEIQLKLCIPIESEFTNKTVEFKVEDLVDFERQLLSFLNNYELKDVIDPNTGLIKNIFAFVVNGREIYHNIKDLTLYQNNNIVIFAYIFGG